MFGFKQSVKVFSVKFSLPTDPRKFTAIRYAVNFFLNRLGDLGVLAEHGSLHQYLLHLHDNGKVPVTSFWWAKTHVVSVCSPQAFKESIRLVNRPREYA